MRCGVCDPRAAEAYLTVRRAARWEQTPQIAADLRPQQEAGEICGLKSHHLARTAHDMQQTAESIYMALGGGDALENKMGKLFFYKNDED